MTSDPTTEVCGSVSRNGSTSYVGGTYAGGFRVYVGRGTGTGETELAAVLGVAQPHEREDSLSE